MARYIKKIEKDEKFISSCLGIALEAEHRVKQNNCVDIYRDYFRYTDEVATLELTTRSFTIPPQATYEHSAELRVVADYADPAPSGRGRPVSAVSWSPDGGTSIAVAYCSPEFLGDRSSEGCSVVTMTVLRQSPCLRGTTAATCTAWRTPPSTPASSGAPPASPASATTPSGEFKIQYIYAILLKSC